MRNMKVVNIAGGLGNQMFQYAFALSIKHHYPNDIVYIDTHHYKGYGLHNGYELNKVFLNIEIPIAPIPKVRAVSRYIPHYKVSRVVRKLLPPRKSEFVEKCNYVFDPEVYKIDGDCYFEGYWQAEGYFAPVKAEIQQAFTFPIPNFYNQTLLDAMKNTHCVGIHIRRGDYLNEPEFMGICDLNYYRQAIQMVLSSKRECAFYIFSNDIEWCKHHIAPLIVSHKVEYVVGNTKENSFWDMFLMSQCDELIIANSSFSWWGAYLNTCAERIIAPKQWVNRNQPIEVWDASWIRI